MALILKKKNNYKSWYEKHKSELSDKRKKRYAEDPEYRQRCLEDSRRRRRGEVTPTTPPDGLISFPEVAKRIGIGKSVLQDWHKKKFFPEPKRHNGRQLWFSEKQVLLLKDLKDKVHGKRRWYGKFDRFKAVIAYMFASWELK